MLWGLLTSYDLQHIHTALGHCDCGYHKWAFDLAKGNKTRSKHPNKNRGVSPRAELLFCGRPQKLQRIYKNLYGIATSFKPHSTLRKRFVSLKDPTPADTNKQTDIHRDKQTNKSYLDNPIPYPDARMFSWTVRLNCCDINPDFVTPNKSEPNACSFKKCNVSFLSLRFFWDAVIMKWTRWKREKTLL